MKRALAPSIAAAIALTMMCLLGIRSASSQPAQEQKPLMAEDVFKNVQVLRGIPVNEFMDAMGFFSASLGADCTYCHVSESSGSWEKYADDNANKRTARRMIQMMSAINETYFGRRRAVTCYSCHRGFDRPKVMPSLSELYGPPPVEEPDEILEQIPGAPSADQVVATYIQAIGGPQRLANLTTFVATGTHQAYADAD